MLCLPASAEPVSVNRGSGLGYVFSHNGNCFLILPAHVHGRGSRVSLATTAPSQAGDAILVHSYAPEIDLSLFYVTSGLEGRCQDRFDTLPEDLGPVLDSAITAQLVRVDASGLETRDDMAITAVDFATISATAAQTEIYQGTSGAILRLGSLPIGMAIQSANTSQASFLRMDEIVARIRRLLSGKTVSPAPVPPDTDTAAGSGLCPQGAIALGAVTCAAEPTAPEYACGNLVAGGITAYPAGTSQRIEVQFATPRPVPLGAVTLAAPRLEGFAVPQHLNIEVSSASGAPRWTRFGALDMPPTGQVTIRNGARPYANRIAVVLQGSWDPHLPAALACLALH